VAKTNYSFEKRQRELAKKKKQEQKLDAKRQKKAGPAEGSESPGGAPAAAPDGETRPPDGSK